jgi:GAF domain-containing protein
MKATASGSESGQNTPLQECQREVEALQAALVVAREQARVAEGRVQTLENANQALQQRERLLEVTEIVANTLLTIYPFDLAVNTALKIIGEALATDRINVLKNFVLTSDSAFPGWRVLYEWNSLGTVPQFSNADAVQGSYGKIQALYEQFQQGQPVSYCIEDMPEPFRSEQMAIGVQSTHLVPIQVEGQWWGVLGIDDCREAKHRNTSELAVLKIAADCIGSAIQRERTQRALLQAEQARSQELAKANEALKRSVERLVASGTLDSVLDSFLLESVAITGAATGAVLQRGKGHEFIMKSLVEDETTIHPFDPHAPQEVYRQRTAADPSGTMRRTAEGEVFAYPVADIEPWFPEAAAYHQGRGHRVIWHFPFRVGGEVAGYLGLAFKEERSLSTMQQETVQALAHQV